MIGKLLFRLSLPLTIVAAVALGSCGKSGNKLSMLDKVEVTEDEAEIVFDTLSHDFGDVLPDTTTSFDFVFHNIGATTLHLESVIPSCGCTMIKWPKGGIEPGDAGVITAIYDSRGIRPGHFSKSIRVYSNAKTRFLRLAISGDIVGD